MAEANTWLERTHGRLASEQIQLQSSVLPVPFVSLLGLTSPFSYSPLNLHTLHNNLSWEMAQHICSTTDMPTFTMWQWHPLLYFPRRSYARSWFQVLYSTALLSVCGLQQFPTGADTLWKASVEMFQPFLKTKWDMHLQGPTKGIRVPQWERSKETEDSNNIKCQSHFPRKRLIVIRSRQM